MKKKTVISVTKDIFSSFVLTIIILLIPFVLGLTVASSEVDPVATILLSIVLFLEIILMWGAILVDFLNGDLKEVNDDI